MAGERQAQFREQFPHAEAAADRQRGSAAAGRGTLLREEIREEIRVLLAPFRADVHLQALIGRGDLDAILAEIARDRAVGDVFRGATDNDQRDAEEGGLRRSYAVRVPDIPGDAGRVHGEGGTAADERGIAERVRGSAANRLAPGTRQHVQRLLDGRVAEVVQVAVVVVHRGVLGVYVIRPDVPPEVALDAQYLACGVGDEGRDAIAALDVSAADIHVETGVVDSVEGLERITLRGEIRRGAERRLLLRGEQRTGARGERVVEEVAAGGDLRLRRVAHVHHFRVHIHMRVDVVV